MQDEDIKKQLQLLINEQKQQRETLNKMSSFLLGDDYHQGTIKELNRLKHGICPLKYDNRIKKLEDDKKKIKIWGKIIGGVIMFVIFILKWGVNILSLFKNVKP